MAYLGASPKASNYVPDVFVGTGTQTAFTMSNAVSNSGSILVIVDGVKQLASSYTVNATTLTFSEAPAADSEIEVNFLALRGTVGTVGDDTISEVKLQDEAVTFAKVASSAVASSADVETGTAADKLLTVDSFRQGALVNSAAVAVSGTSVEFTGIPSWVKRITFNFSGLSTSATSIAILQLGDSGGFEITGYAGSTNATSSATTATAVPTSGVALYGSFANAQTLSGSVIFTLVDSATNTWVASVLVGRTDGSSAGNGGWNKSLSSTLTQLRLTTVNGTDTFDAGTVNIIYE